MPSFAADDSARPLAPASSPATIDYNVRGDFVDWLAEAGGSLAVATYNSGTLAVASAPEGRLTLGTWKFPRPMGLAFDGRRLALAVRQQFLVFQQEERDPARADHAAAGGAGREPTLLAPAKCYPTGRLDVHDVAVGVRGWYFVATRFNCIARPSERVNFQRSWQPAFVPQTTPHDCCHLNGLGMREGRPALATAFCERGEPGAWRGGDRFASGVILDVRADAVVARGLNMPHSPRWHAGRWWFCNSGEGALCTLDAERGQITDVAVLPGFTRGLCFAAGRAIVGRSRIRRRHILDAPPVRRRFGSLKAGVSLVDLATGRETGALDFESGGREVYDAAFLPGMQRLAFSAGLADQAAPPQRG